MHMYVYKHSIILVARVRECWCACLVFASSVLWFTFRQRKLMTEEVVFTSVLPYETVGMSLVHI